MDVVKQSAKAIVAFVVTAVCVWLTKKGLNVDVDTQAALVSALSGLVVAVSVWVTRNQPWVRK